MLRIVNSVAGVVERACVFACIVMMAVIAVVINLQVFFRYVLRSPLIWTMELTGFLLVYTVLLGAGVALRRRKFAYVELVVGALPKPIRLAFEILGSCLVVMFVSVAFWASKDLIWRAGITNILSPALGARMSTIYEMLRVAFGVQIFFALVVLANQLSEAFSMFGAASASRRSRA